MSTVTKTEKELTWADRILVEQGSVLSAEQRGRLRHAQRLEMGSKREKRRAREMCGAVERELREGLIGNVVALERARGGLVDIPPVGPIRMRSHDGLQALHEDGKLSLDDYQMGLRYRAMHEALHHGLGSQLDDSAKGGGVKINALVAGGAERAFKHMHRARIERQVAVRCEEVVALTLLRQVAGEGRTVRSEVAGGKQASTAVETLREALGVVRDVLAEIAEEKRRARLTGGTA